MADSPYTGVEHIEPNQAQKEVTANNGFDRLSLFIAETTSLTITGDTLLTEVQAQEAVRFDLGGTPGAGFLLELPSTVKKFFIVNNGSGQTADVQVAGGGGASVNVNDGAQFLLYTDGTDIITLSSSASGTLAGLSETDLGGAENGDALVKMGSDWVAVKIQLWNVLDRDENDSASVTPSQDDAYIVASGGLNDWSGQDDSIAYYQSGVWEFVQPFEGLLAYLVDEDKLVKFDGASWVDASAETFTALSDTPGTITAKQRVRGNAGGTAVEFVEDPLDVGVYKPGLPTGSEVIARWVATRDFTFPSGLTGSQAYADTAPADGAKDFDVQKNGASVGTVSFALGSNTATFSMASATSFVAGDRLAFVAPATADSALADIAITLKGTKD